MKPLAKDVIIKGERLTLRPITAADTDNILIWRNSKNVVDNFFYRKPVTRQDHERWLEEKVKTGRVHQFIITVNETGQDVGSVYLQNFDEEHNKVEWGVFIGDIKEIYGKGYGTETCGLIKSYAFDTLHFHKISARILEKNIPSRRMNEKNGFVVEGILKDEGYFDGKYENLCLYAAINEEC